MPESSYNVLSFLNKKMLNGTRYPHTWQYLKIKSFSKYFSCSLRPVSSFAKNGQVENFDKIFNTCFVLRIVFFTFYRCKI